MDRNLLSTIPVGVSAGFEDGGSPAWGLLGSQILSETATGTHGPGALINDSLTPGLLYVPVLVSRSAETFVLYPNGSFEGPNPSTATYSLYEENTGLVGGSPEQIVIGGGGGGPSVVKRKGWANERAALEESLRKLERISSTMEKSDEPKAQEIAAELEDYSGEAEQIETLRRNLESLQIAQRRKELTEQKERDVQSAAKELQAILDDDEEVADTLDVLLQFESRVMRMFGVR